MALTADVPFRAFLPTPPGHHLARVHARLGVHGVVCIVRLGSVGVPPLLIDSLPLS
jgi:hypothetical protein